MTFVADRYEIAYLINFVQRKFRIDMVGSSVKWLQNVTTYFTFSFISVKRITPIHEEFEVVNFTRLNSLN